MTALLKSSTAGVLPPLTLMLKMLMEPPVDLNDTEPSAVTVPVPF